PKMCLRVLGVGLRTPFTGGAEALRGATEAGRSGRFGRSSGWKSGIEQARRAGKLGRIWLVFVSERYLTLMISEEICGRFGFISMDQRLYIALLGFGR
ncbi:hypothetical protein ABMC89_18920, partial [Sulfitobacter sp. HNIBRBA3233]|uniref:hypothetical protein n=1 Tax=Sulfitobacter marinivivus TaxID=3158558 RepID=UPI0032DEBD35